VGARTIRTGRRFQEQGEDLRRAEFFQEFEKVLAAGVAVRSILEGGNIWGNGDFAVLYAFGNVAFMTPLSPPYTQRVAGSSPAPPTIYKLLSGNGIRPVLAKEYSADKPNFTGSMT